MGSILNLLVISERFWPEGSGGTLATYLITKLLITSGFKVTIITGTCNPVKISGVDLIIDEAFRISNKPARWLHFLNPSVKKRYKRLMKKFDIIYIPYGYPLIPLAKELGKRVIVHLHDYQPVTFNSTILHKQDDMRINLISEIKKELTYELFEHGSIMRAITGSLSTPITILCRRWVTEADALLCVSQRQAEIISKLAPELAYKIKVVYNPLPEPPSMEEKFEEPTFIYSGGGSYVKGFHIFIQASLNVLKRGNSASFMLTGGLRGFRHRHMRLLERLNSSLMGSFRLLGHLPYEDVLRLYSRSYAVLVPSVWEEPLPYVVMEAMLAGTIPIASKVGGIPEIVKGTYAEKFLFTPGNVNELIGRMEEVLSLSNEQLIDIGVKLREVILKKFDRNIIKDRLLEIFAD